MKTQLELWHVSEHDLNFMKTQRRCYENTNWMLSKQDLNFLYENTAWTLQNTTWPLWIYELNFMKTHSALYENTAWRLGTLTNTSFIAQHLVRTRYRTSMSSKTPPPPPRIKIFVSATELVHYVHMRLLRPVGDTVELMGISVRSESDA